ncbi:MAG: ATP-grasp domain-containing protein [bacterium]
MKIAFTYLSDLGDANEAHAAARDMAAALTRLGHEVTLVDVAEPLVATVSLLTQLAPDLVLNTARARGGRGRESFYPALFADLGLHHTGSAAAVHALTLNPALTRRHLAAHGIRTLRSRRIVDRDDLAHTAPNTFRMPVTLRSDAAPGEVERIDSYAMLEERVTAELARGQGVWIEEVVPGRHVVVPVLEAGAAPGGVLDPIAIVPRERPAGSPRSAARARRSRGSTAARAELPAWTIEAPARLSTSLRRALVGTTRAVIECLDIRDFGRVDFRIAEDETPFVIEVDPLPGLEPSATLCVAAALRGLEGPERVLDAIVRSTARRYGIPTHARRAARTRKRPLRVGFTFNVKRTTPIEGVDESEAEYDSPKTIGAIHDAIASLGHEVIDLEATPQLPTRLVAAAPDVVFNMAEGVLGRNRESQVPALLELLGIPYTGSDPAALAMALDKELAKRLVAAAGVATPAWFLAHTGRERFPRELGFPAIVKPVTEGSSKGVVPKSVVENEAQARAVAREMIERYQQPALVEGYLPGREFTVGLLGERNPRALPPMEIVFLDKRKKRPVYAFEHKQDWSKEIRYDTPARVDPALLRELTKAALTAFHALGCRDVARVDLRLDAAGRVNFVELNPLPGLSPGWSDLCLIAASAGIEYRDLIGRILAPAIRRFRAGRRVA